MGKTRKGATAPPMDEPLSKNAVARARSRFGNHSETAFAAAGQFADSPAPTRKRQNPKLAKPLAKPVAIETTEYQVTAMVNPRRVPMRSINLPRTTCPIEYATRKVMTIFA